MRPSSQSTCALAIVAWPHRSTSTVGVNQRRLNPSATGTRNAVSARFISRATCCIHEGARFAEAERQALLARGDYHTVVRRLHLGGGSLREIAQALGLSHQRVQQIVKGAGGSWWQRVWRTRMVGRDAVCTFCDRSSSE